MEDEISKPVRSFEKQREYIAIQIVAEYLRERFRGSKTDNRNIVILDRGVDFVGARQVLSLARHERASAFLKAKMKEADITYAELAKRLKKHGLKETEAGITMKLKRGTFAATFFLACLAAMELEGVVLEEI